MISCRNKPIGPPIISCSIMISCKINVVCSLRHCVKAGPAGDRVVPEALPNGLQYRAVAELHVHWWQACIRRGQPPELPDMALLHRVISWQQNNLHHCLQTQGRSPESPAWAAQRHCLEHVLCPGAPGAPGGALSGGQTAAEGHRVQSVDQHAGRGGAGPGHGEVSIPALDVPCPTATGSSLCLLLVSR